MNLHMLSSETLLPGRRWVRICWQRVRSDVGTEVGVGLEAELERVVVRSGTELECMMLAEGGSVYGYKEGVDTASWERVVVTG